MNAHYWVNKTNKKKTIVNKKESKNEKYHTNKSKRKIHLFELKKSVHILKTSRTVINVLI